MKEEFLKELETLINKFSLENKTNTPDFILAQYLKTCLDAYEMAIVRRIKWEGIDEKNNSLSM